MKKIIYLVIFLIFTIFNYKYFQSHVFTFHFVDEDENIVAGYYMGKGEKLYKDIFSHKQPLPAVISMIEQKVQKPNSLYLLIKRHREIVYFYSIVWTLILIISFGVPGLLFGILFEIIKQYQLGNMFLSESLVVFPLAYSLGYLWKIFNLPRHSGESQNLYNRFSNRFRVEPGMTKLIETILFSSCLSLILFLQFTLIPYVFIVLIILFLSKKVTVKQLFTSLPDVTLVKAGYFLPFTFLFIICFPFVDYRYCIDNTISAIRSIYLGGSAADNPLNILYYSFLRPIAVIIEMKKSEFGTFTGFTSLGYLLSFIWLFITQKTQRKFLVLSYFLLGLCSLRIVYPDKTFYSGFHGLPWLGAFLFITIFQIIYALRVTHYALKLKTKICFIYFIAIIFLVFVIRNSLFLIQDYYRKSDRETDWYVNFSRYYDFGQTIRILSGKGDKLMVLPAEQLIYWQSGLPHATRFLYVYLFVDPKYKKELYDYWDKTPPAFIYDEQNLSLFKKWWPIYARVKRNGNDTPLFIRKDKIPKLSDWQYNEINRFKFSIDK